MCQAIVKPANVYIEKSVLRSAWQSNQDGAGLCYVNATQDEVVIEKGFFKFKAFYKAYKMHQDKALLIHLRYATHGTKTKENCHPFMMAKDAALIHNGILSGFTPPLNSPISDTRVFTDGYFSQGLRVSGLQAHDYLSSIALRSFVEALIGKYNKLAVMTTKGIVIFNEGRGEWKDGVWYSAGYPCAASDDLVPVSNLRYAGYANSCDDEIWFNDVMRTDTRPNQVRYLDSCCEGRAIPDDGFCDEKDNEYEDSYCENADDEDTGNLVCACCYYEIDESHYQLNNEAICAVCWDKFCSVDTLTDKHG